jgi:hypothetical protein
MARAESEGGGGKSCGAHCVVLCDAADADARLCIPPPSRGVGGGMRMRATLVCGRPCRLHDRRGGLICILSRATTNYIDGSFLLTFVVDSTLFKPPF